MKVYQLLPAFFSQLRQRLLTILIPVFIAIIGFVIWRNSQVSSNGTQWLTYLIVGVVLLGVVITIVIPQQLKSWASYRLTLDQDWVLRERAGMPEIKIHKHEIARIREHSSTGLSIEQKGSKYPLVIPVQIQNYEEIRAHLEQWQAIESVPSQNLIRNIGLLILFALLPLIGFYIFGTATNPLVIVSVGIILIVMLLGSLVLTQRDPNLDKRNKRGMWFIVIPVFFIGWRVIEQIPHLFSNR